AGAAGTSRSSGPWATIYHLHHGKTSSISPAQRRNFRMRAMTTAVIWVASVLMATSVTAQSADAERGERVFNQQCKLCHTVDKGGLNAVGPNLNGLVGKKAGVEQGFTASEAMTKSGIMWDDKTLGEYLKDPKAKVPGTKMVYAGLKNQGQLDDLIAYLHKATQ